MRGDGHRHNMKGAMVVSAGLSVATGALLGLFLGTILAEKHGSAVGGPVGFLLGLALGLHRAYRIFRDMAQGRGRS